MLLPILYNKCYGGFDFSTAFVQEYFRRRPTSKLPKPTHAQTISGSFDHDTIRRTDLLAIAIFEEKGSEWSSGKHSKLCLHHVPADLFKYVYIGEYDGFESVCVDWEKAFNDLVLMTRREEQVAFHQRLMEYAHPPQAQVQPQKSPPQPQT